MGDNPWVTLIRNPSHQAPRYRSLETNALYYGDNLEILRHGHVPKESIDLIYLDPPFNSKADYNILFKEATGEQSHAQIQAFTDFWHWDRESWQAYNELTTKAESEDVANLTKALFQFLGKNDMMAYLVMMAVRLSELHRVLKSTGSLFLHCDSTASHYLRLMLDSIFGPNNFRNEIVWKRKTGRGETNHQARRFGVSTDSLLFYTKTDKYPFKPQFSFDAKGYGEYVSNFYKYVDEKGRRYRIADLSSPSLRPNLTYDYKGYKPPKNGWAISRAKMEQWDREGRLEFPAKVTGRIQRRRFLDELKGKPIQNLWDDIEPLSSQASERLHYPTQKPVALLERIINTCSDEGDWILDPFCGCGTAIAAAEKLHRHWIGIDITYLAIDIVKGRLTREFPLAQFKIEGEPKDMIGAMELAERDRYQFQWWAVSLVGAIPYGATISHPREGKKGADRVVDGWLNFSDGSEGNTETIIVQVKSGHVGVKDIRELRDAVNSRRAAIGIFVTLETPTAEMSKEARETEPYLSPRWGGAYPRIQILTINELLSGGRPKLPPGPGLHRETSAEEGYARKVGVGSSP